MSQPFFMSRELVSRAGMYVWAEWLESRGKVGLAPPNSKKFARCEERTLRRSPPLAR